MTTVREALLRADNGHTSYLEELNDNIDKTSARLIRMKEERKEVRKDRADILEALHQLDLAEGKS